MTFSTSVAAATEDVHEKGVRAKIGGPPDRVAAVVETSLSAGEPQTRCTAPSSARVPMTLHSVAGDRGWDRVCRGPFPRPGDDRPPGR